MDGDHLSTFGFLHFPRGNPTAPMPHARNLGVVMDNRLSLSENIAAVTQSCRFFLYIWIICPFLTPYSIQLLVQAMVLSRLDYWNPLLAGLPASAIRPLQLIHNAAACLVFNLPRHSHVNPPAHWLPAMACIKFKTLVQAFQAVKGWTPAYLQNIYTPTPTPTPVRPLCSAAANSRFHLPVTTTACSGSTMVEWPPRRGQDSRNSD